MNSNTWRELTHQVEPLIRQDRPFHNVPERSAETTWEEIKIAPAKPEANVMDLMAALQASIEAVKPIPADPGTTTAKPKKRAPRKTPAQAVAGGESDTPAAPAKRKKATPKPKV